MKNVTMIACAGKNNELGYQNQLLWHIPEDMKFFKENTMGKPVIMGRKTYESLPKKLEGRKNIILSRNMKEEDGITIYRSMKEILEWIKEYQKEVMIIGGEAIYREFMKDAEKLLLTRVEKEKEADVFFPEIKEEEWQKEVLAEKEHKDIKYKHLVYTRKH